MATHRSLGRNLASAAMLVLALGGMLAPSLAMARDKPKSPEIRQEIKLDRAPEGLDCRRMVRQAEIRHRIPSELLAAIALTESGRWLEERQANIAWPWTVYAQGSGRQFPDQAAAVAGARTLLEQGVRNIDVGCMQINLQYHPNAFENLDEALTPAANIDYAARLLRRLYREHHSWGQAVAHYHSATKALNAPYRSKVMRLWYKERHRAIDERRRLAQADFNRRLAAVRRARGQVR